MSSTESPPAETAPRRRFSERVADRWMRAKAWMRRALRRLAYLFGPIVATGLLWLLIKGLTNPGYAQAVAVAGGISLFGAGTTVVLGQAVFPEITLGPWQLAFIVMWVNAASAFWYVYNLDLLERLPKIGPTLHRMREESKNTLAERRWIRRLSVVGVGAFVVTPLPGSGALGGAIMGRLIGVSRFASFASVTVAGIIVCVVYAMFANKLASTISEVPTWQRILGAVLVFGTLFVVMRWWSRRGAARNERRDTTVVEETEQQPASTPTPVAVSNSK